MAKRTNKPRPRLELIKVVPYYPEVFSSDDEKENAPDVEMKTRDSNDCDVDKSHEETQVDRPDDAPIEITNELNPGDDGASNSPIQSPNYSLKESDGESACGSNGPKQSPVHTSKENETENKDESDTETDLDCSDTSTYESPVRKPKRRKAINKPVVNLQQKPQTITLVKQNVSRTAPFRPAVSDRVAAIRSSQVSLKNQIDKLIEAHGTFIQAISYGFENLNKLNSELVKIEGGDWTPRK